jgi:hypothetical protein
MMHAPTFAKELVAAGKNGVAGVCQSDCIAKQAFGYFVPFSHVLESPDRCEAVVNLLVHDLSSTFLHFLPFVIDTGTDVTIIPRRLLRQPEGEWAFQLGKTLSQYEVMGLTGRVVIGLRFRSTIALIGHQPGSAPLCLGELQPIVVADEDWDGDYGMLGLDALRQVIMVSDRDHISLWPSPTARCSAQ